MQARIIKFGDITLPDPNPNMHIDDVRKLYAATYPALNNAVAHYIDGGGHEFKEKPKDGSSNVKFTPTAGKKA